MQYNNKIEEYCDFRKKIKKFKNEGVKLGLVIGTPFRYGHYGPDEEYFKLLQEVHNESIPALMKEHNLSYIKEVAYGRDSSKQVWKMQEENEAKCLSIDICMVLIELTYYEVTEERKRKLVDLINKTSFTKVGILLHNYLNYAELSAITLKGVDSVIYNLFATDPRFTIKFEHVLRYYHYETSDGEETVVRFNHQDFTNFDSGAKPATEDVDPDLKHVPFYQLGKGKVMLKFKHKGGSVRGGYDPEEMQMINFAAAMIIVKNTVAQGCDNQPLKSNAN